MRPVGTKAELEQRRRLAVALHDTGMTVREVAEEVGIVVSDLPRAIRFYRLLGLAFQLPIVLTLLIRFGLLTTATLARGRRYAVVILLTIAAFICHYIAASLVTYSLR